MDSTLNELGLRQADAVAEALKNVPFTHAFSSDLSRARTTAEAILRNHDIPLTTQRALREKSFGAGEGLPYGTKVTDKGETLFQFRKRIVGWWIQTMSEFFAAPPPEESSILTSDPDFFFSSFMNGGKLGMMPNVGVATLEATGVYEGKLLSYADDSHLKKLQEVGVNVESLTENVDDLAA